MSSNNAVQMRCKCGVKSLKKRENRQEAGVTGRETKYILTHHKPAAINPPYSSINMKHDKEERIK